MATYPYRSEILFLYDVFRCNPNGDPFENRPRQDLVTGRIEVTDVRLKRTVRDYISSYKHDPAKDDGLEIFVRVAEEKTLTAERRYEQIFGALPKASDVAQAKDRLVKKCIDVRLFGALVPIGKRESEEGGGIQITGAVQFNPGTSLHAVDVHQIDGTGGFASKEGARQKTFRREFIVPYALIGFYGVINENLARHSGLTDDDVFVLMEALWYGTLALHSRSKAFHHPRLLLRFDYINQAQCGYFLDKVKLEHAMDDERHIRSPKDYTVNLTGAIEVVEKRKEDLMRVECWVDSGLSLSPEDLENVLKERLITDEQRTLVFKRF